MNLIKWPVSIFSCYDFITHNLVSYHDTTKPVQFVYKQALKVPNNKPKSSCHHCNVLPKYGFLCWENLINFHNACLIYKTLTILAPPPLNTCQKNVRDKLTRSSLKGDNTVPMRKHPFARQHLQLELPSSGTSSHQIIPLHVTLVSVSLCCLVLPAWLLVTCTVMLIDVQCS